MDLDQQGVMVQQLVAPYGLEAAQQSAALLCAPFLRRSLWGF